MGVLLTGGAGYIGSHCWRALSEAEGAPEIVVLDDYSTGSRALLGEDATCIEGSVGDVAKLEEVFSAHEIDAVIHFAGSVVVPESVADPGKYYRNNTCGSMALMDFCSSRGVGSFIFSSTASVYGNGTGRPCSERDPALPGNPYAASKLMTEMMLADFARASGMNYAILRYFNVAGADALLRCGQIGEATHLIRVACQAALGVRDHVPVFGTDYPTPDGTCVRDYIHVTDLAEAHLCVLRQLRGRERGSFGEIYNCGYGHGYSVREVLRALREVAGRSIRQVDAERRAGDPGSLVADPARLKAAAGWSPKLDSLETIIGSALAWEESLLRSVPRGAPAGAPPAIPGGGR